MVFHVFGRVVFRFKNMRKGVSIRDADRSGVVSAPEGIEWVVVQRWIIVEVENWIAAE